MKKNYEAILCNKTIILLFMLSINNNYFTVTFRNLHLENQTEIK